MHISKNSFRNLIPNSLTPASIDLDLLPSTWSKKALINGLCPSGGVGVVVVRTLIHSPCQRMLTINSAVLNRSQREILGLLKFLFFFFFLLKILYKSNTWDQLFWPQQLWPLKHGTSGRYAFFQLMSGSRIEVGTRTGKCLTQPPAWIPCVIFLILKKNKGPWLLSY